MQQRFYGFAAYWADDYSSAFSFIKDSNARGIFSSDASAVDGVLKTISYYNQVYNKYNERFLNQERNMKELLHYLRGVLACKWIERKGKLPSTYFDSLVRATVDDPGIRAKINALIEIKRSGKNVDEVAVDPELIEYARNLAQHYDEVVKITPEEQIEESPNKLNMIFQNTLRNFN